MKVNYIFMVHFIPDPNSTSYVEHHDTPMMSPRESFVQERGSFRGC